ncbi:MAG: hypothetical protein K6F77_07160, partial [Lachnospiraceae bacterium]|nr:hypothetical protein [Lachnospiraceae bacterium]
KYSKEQITLTQSGEEYIINGFYNTKKKYGFCGISYTIDDNSYDDIDLSEYEVDEVDEVLEPLLNCDYNRAGLGKYDKMRLQDINLGHWDLWNFNGYVKTIGLKNGIVARNPIADIREDAVVGIDFGTKSTVVSYQDKNNRIQTMRIGCGRLKEKVSQNDFENPTVLQFYNINKFKEDYCSSGGRPNTSFEDLTVSYEAYERMHDNNIKSEEYYSFFKDLKQWAGSSKSKKINVRDMNGEVITLDKYLNLKDTDMDPIEIYAYYVGLHINNMTNGIYLNYLLSFPVTYEKNIREKILNSFTKGIKKSLPNTVINNKDIMSKFKVEQGVSEPEAYAICALEEYGFNPKPGEKVAYAVFDFGGGTTDFDFGIWEGLDDDYCDYSIEHFGAQGDKYLGGENLLDLIAWQVFIDNMEVCRKYDIHFDIPNEIENIPEGIKYFVDGSQEAKFNMYKLTEALRPFWERAENDSEDIKKSQKNGSNNEDDDKKSSKNNLKEIKISFFKNDGSLVSNISFKVDYGKLEKILEDRIDKGVTQFYHALKNVLSNNEFLQKTKSIERINIFLAGNASKSVILQRIFNKRIDEWESEIENNSKGISRTKDNKFIVLYPPLGDDKKAAKDNTSTVLGYGDCKPNGKTGVAYGLIEGRPGGSILTISRDIEIDLKEEINFNYYLGISRRKKFRTILDRNVKYGKWYKFISAGREDFEILYTTLPEATSEEVADTENGVYRKRCHIDKTDKNAYVYVKPTSPSTIEYAIGVTEKSIIEDTITKVTFE